MLTQNELDTQTKKNNWPSQHQQQKICVVNEWNTFKFEKEQLNIKINYESNPIALDYCNNYHYNILKIPSKRFYISIQCVWHPSEFSNISGGTVVNAYVFRLYITRVWF
jgi:hypothetical protein